MGMGMGMGVGGVGRGEVGGFAWVAIWHMGIDAAWEDSTRANFDAEITWYRPHQSTPPTFHKSLSHKVAAFSRVLGGAIIGLADLAYVCTLERGIYGNLDVEMALLRTVSHAAAGFLSRAGNRLVNLLFSHGLRV